MVSQCQVLHITRARNTNRHQYVLHGQILESVDHAKYLGLEISRGGYQFAVYIENRYLRVDMCIESNMSISKKYQSPMLMVKH